jgi:hypothetical protein
MNRLEKEVEENYDKFVASYRKGIKDTANSLEAQKEKYLESYRRIVSLQAWRSELLEPTVSPDSLAFFLEAQNDALTSHVLASFGSWRSSLKSLRSCIENVMYCLYYKDHPVELLLWHDGHHRPAFAAMEKYFQEHPQMKSISPQAAGLDSLSSEYSTLSRAVHASAKSFRMSVEDVGVQLWSDDIVRLGSWGTRERTVISALNLLLMAMFREQLEGGRAPNLRKAISLVIPSSKHAQIKALFGVVLYPKAK